MPSLAELTALFDVLPEVPPPMPRARRKPPANAGGAKPHEKAKGGDVKSKTLGTGGKAEMTSTPPTYTSWLLRWPFGKQTVQPPVKPAQQRRPHPMAAIKQGKKVAIIAVVDAGSPSFFRFGQGDFSEWPMVG